MRVKCQLYFKHFTIIAYTTDYKVKRAQNQVIKSKKTLKNTLYTIEYNTLATLYLIVILMQIMKILYYTGNNFRDEICNFYVLS